MTEVFRRYPGAPPEEKDPPRCVVSHPDAGGPCERVAVGEVWSLPFCEIHGREAELAAKVEIHATTDQDLEQILQNAQFNRLATNPYLLEIFRTVRAPFGGYEDAHEEAMCKAYPPEVLAENTDPATLAFTYGEEYVSGETGGACPVDWWADTLDLLCRFVREADHACLPPLLRELEYLREQATVQLVLATRDYDLRYGEARPRQRGAVAE
jgi:hypothetical protein